MVVMQLLAADDQPEGDDVGGQVRGLEVPIPPPMPDTVEDSGREKGNPQHLPAHTVNPIGPKSSRLMASIRQ